MAATGRARVVYTDLDGTLLGGGGSLFRTAAGEFTLAGAEALALCHQHGVELSLISGRNGSMLHEDARLLGIGNYIGEAGCLVVREGGRVTRVNCGPFGSQPGLSVFAEITATGAPELLLGHFSPRLAYHDPWYREHDYSHLLRGQVPVAEANRLLKERGLDEVRLVDNGTIEDRGFNMPVEELHAYHIIPAAAGKGSAIRMDLELAGLSREDAIACGDSPQDLEMAAEVRTFYLVANGAAGEDGFKEEMAARDNIVVVEAHMVEGFLEAMRRELLLKPRVRR